jgi:hypothetical protein
MRYEIKFIKMQKVNNLGYFNLKDLIDNGLTPFKTLLITEFNKIIYYDNTIKSNSKLVDKYNNPHFWYDLVSNKNKSSLYKKHINQLKELTKNYSDNTLFHTNLVLTNKIDYLLD